MPFLSSVFTNGAGGRLTTTFPPVTAPAWASFMTGKNPGKHGVFEFLYRRRGQLRQTPVNSRTVGAPTLWQMLSNGGKRLAAINVPLTYPPHPVNGLIIGDFLTPRGAQDYTYPPELLQQLETRFGPYPLYHTQVYTPSNVRRVVDELYHHQNYVFTAAHHLLAQEPWDLFMVHFAGTDRLQHELWHIIDPSHPMHNKTEAQQHADAVRGFFTMVDKQMQSLVWEAGENVTTILMSDHGFGPIHHFVNFNTWLLTEGFLHLRGDVLTRLRRVIFHLGLTPALGYRLGMRLGLANLRLSQGMSKRFTVLNLINRVFLSLVNVDWSRTVAYSRGNYGQIYVNLKGREEHGSIEPGTQYEEVCAHLVERLHALRDPATGQPVVAQVFRRHDLYNGPYVDNAPDVVFLLRPTYKALGTLDFSSNRVVESAFGNSGDHHMDGFLAMQGPGVRPGHGLDGARILDMAPTILYLLGLPIPADMDGQVLAQALTPEFMATHAVTVAGPHAEAAQGETGYTAEEEEEITRRLERLGYLG